MSLDIAHEVWEVLRSHIDVHERKDAADDLVNLLVDNNYDAPDIKEAFRGDKDIASALKFYAEQHDPEDDELEETDDEEDEW